MSIHFGLVGPSSTKLHNYIHWLGAKNTAKWTLNDPPPDIFIFVGGFLSREKRPAADADADDDKLYMSTVLRAFSLAKQRKIPILGICLGFEMLGTICLPDATPDDFFREKRISHHHETGIVKMNTGEHVYVNHDKSFLLDTDYIVNLIKNVDILATRPVEGKNTKEYVMAFKYKKYPFYGVMFHPEKMPHSKTSKEIKQFLLSL